MRYKPVFLGERPYNSKQTTSNSTSSTKPVDDTKVNRNAGGAILITTNTPVIKTSLQCQAFVYEDYRKAIDTSFSELVGKM